MGTELKEGDSAAAAAARLYTYRIAAVAALGGLLFGFDTAIINGAIVFLKRQFAWTEVQTEVAASSLLLGCVLGASLAGALSDWLGRRRLLLAAAALFGLSSLATAIPHTLAQFCAARIAAGLAIGVASMLCPLYIAEISPAAIRGRLVSLNQLAIVSGILISYLIGWSLSGIGPDSWRWMFASAAAPSVLFFAALFFVPESPRWLVKEARRNEALQVLADVGEAQPAERADEIEAAIALETGRFSDLLQPRMRRLLWIGITLAVLQQVTGINTIIYYGSIIFTEHAGARSAAAALWANVIIGSTNLVCTIAALFLIDTLGRKSLLMIASAGMGVSLAALGILMRADPSATTPILILILCYVAFFSTGMGPGVWVVLSEIFPTSIRGRAMSIATISLWIACMLITLTFLSLAKAISISGAFWVYGVMCAATLVFLHKFTVETKGKTLEQIEKEWSGK
ncbi:MAG TPA: sugar porter family MFS transporter [Bryobacteraceae bacterium]|nr:sugar porter family MFS transporter [Bryobacteraceae bacterium]